MCLLAFLEVGEGVCKFWGSLNAGKVKNSSFIYPIVSSGDSPFGQLCSLELNSRPILMISRLFPHI